MTVRRLGEEKGLRAELFLPTFEEEWTMMPMKNNIGFLFLDLFP